LQLEAAVQAERVQAAAVADAHAAELQRVGKLAEFQTGNAKQEVEALERMVGSSSLRPLISSRTPP
jgi:hypothetical protein